MTQRNNYLVQISDDHFRISAAGLEVETCNSFLMFLVFLKLLMLALSYV